MTYRVWCNGDGEIVAVLPSTVHECNPIYAITHDPRNVLLNETQDPARFLDGTIHDPEAEPSLRVTA